MSFIHLRFRTDHDDVVVAAERARLPLRGPSGRIYVLHKEGVVTQHPTTEQASFALTSLPGAELLMWLIEDSAVATVLAREETRLVVRFDLTGTAPDEQRAAALAVSALLAVFEAAGVVDVDVTATLDDAL